MVGVLNAEAAEFIPTAAVVQVAAAASASDAGGDRRQSGRNPRRANRGQARSTGQHIRISTGRRGNPSSGGRGVNPAHPQRKKWSTRGDEVHPGRAHEATGVESVTSAQRGGRRVGSSGGPPSRDATAAQAQPAATSSVGPGQASVHGRPRNKGSQRRRRSQDERVQPVDDRASGSIPRPPRPKRAGRGNETRPSGSSRSTDGRPLARAVADPVAQTGDGKGAGGRAVDVTHSAGNGKIIEPSREVGCPEEVEKEEAFPALPPASGRMPSPTPVVSRPGSLNYSALAERLAIETAATAAAAAAAEAASGPSGAAGGTAGGTISRLSVLPSFGDARRGDADPGGARSDDPPEPPNSQVCDDSSPRFLGAQDSTSGKPLPPTLPSRSKIENTRLRAGAETAALRARLRERWFRLEATRKAQRQRESAERELMAAEDGGARSAHEQGGGAKGSGARTQRRDGLTDPAGAVDDGGSSEGGCNGRRGSTSSTSSSSEEEFSDKERPERPLSSSYTATTSRVQKPSAEASCPGGIAARYTTTESDNTSANTARGVEASSSREPRAVSAAGIAAMRRFEAAAAAASVTAAPSPSTETVASTGPDAAWSAHQDLSTQGASDETGVSDEAADRDDAARASLGHREKKQTAVAAPCEGDSGDGGGVSALHGERVHAACEAGMAGLLNDLLVRSGGRVAHGKDKSRRTPLHLAAEAGSLECVNLLLKQGTRLDQRDKWRETPLHKAARSGNAGIVKALCTARMKVNVRNRHRETPLLLAVCANAVDIVSVLLGFGARLDDPDVNGVTPFVQAAMSGQAELLMAMANSNQAWKSSNREGAAPQTMVAMADPASKARGNNATGNRRALPSSLYQGPANRGRGGGRGNGAPIPALSPVHEAAAAGQTETLSLLLQLGVSLEERDSAAAAGGGGDTPLGRAVRAGRLDCAKLLLEAGAMIGRENARGETPLVIAIRAGQASGVELLTRHGAPLEGGRSNGKLIAADGRAPAGAREKMMARRRVEPLELALREGQFACAAVLIEGGARITEGALRSVKLHPAAAASTEKSTAQGSRARYAGTSADGGYQGSAWSATTAERSAASASANLLPLQTDIRQLMSPEISALADSSPPDGGGLEAEEDPNISLGAPDGTGQAGGRLWQGEDVAVRRESRRASAGAGRSAGVSAKEGEGGRTQHVGGLLPGLGECDVVLVLDDGSRLPAHSCLLAAFSGAFRDLFLRRDGLDRRGGLRCVSCDGANRCSGGTSAATAAALAGTSDEASCAAANGDVGSEDDQRKRSRDVQSLLVGRRVASEEVHGKRSGFVSEATAAAAAAAAACAATCIAENAAWRSPAVVEWKPARGDVRVRFWGAGTMAAAVRHMYTGQTPAGVHIDGLGRLLAASVALGMPRLMRQVEHLLSASLSSQKGNGRSAQLEEVARLLRAARVLRATDLEHRCTLYLQANGGFPAVMKLRRELRVPALNASDVTRGLARLTGSGYLGSGPAHAWSSSGAVAAAPGSTAVVAAAKRAVDLSLRKRAVDFDQLVPLLLDPPRCASTLCVGYPERAVLLMAALAAACPGGPDSPPAPNKIPGQQRQEQGRRRRAPVCCGHGSSGSGSSRGEGQEANPLASNFSAFSHGVGWLLRTGTVADVVLVLPSRPCTVVEPGAACSDTEEDRDEGKESDAAGMETGDDDTDDRELRAQAAAGAVNTSHGGITSGNDPDHYGTKRPTPASAAKDEGAAEATNAKTHFLAHSMVLAARSEKFAAMLRFVRRQDDGGGVCADGDTASSADDGASNDCEVCRPMSSGGVRRGDVGAPEEATCGERQNGGSSGVDPLPSSSSGCRTPRHCRCRRPLRRPRRDPPPRELELHSPLLSPRSLGLFLGFLYTGVLDPSLCTGELSELALIADEYLVPDLTQQAEALLVESLALRNAGGHSYSSPAAGQTTCGITASNHGRREEEDTASTPLDVLQLGVSLGLPELSAAAARAVLLQLENVSRSEAFEASGMTKRELVVAALEAARS